MSMLSRFQFNAIVRAGLAAAAVTVGSLGYQGGNVGASTDYSTAYLHSNALLDTRGFTTFNSGGGNPPLDATTGLPTTSSTLCFTTAPSTTQYGNLQPGNYFLNVYSVGQTVTASYSGGSTPGAATVGTGVLLGDGVTIRYPVTYNAGVAGTAAFNFSGPMSQMPDLARDGSATAVGQPLFANTALAFYSKLPVLRLMDFLSTNPRTDTTWATRPGNWPMHAYALPYSWEKMVAFINAVVAYPGSVVKGVLINIPGYVDQTYVGNLATLLNTAGLTSNVHLYIDRANEHWNSNPVLTFFGNYLNSANAELNYLFNYTASPNVTSVTSDGTNLTFTTTAPIGSYLTTTANCVVVGGVGGFGLGSIASPVVATKTGANTFTIPSTGNAGTGQFGVIFNLTSTLLADGVLPTPYSSGSKWYVRLLHQDQQTWSAIRPQDRFFMDLQQYGGEVVNGTSSQPVEYAYGAFLGGGVLSSWLYGAAIAPYNAAQNIAYANLDALFANLNAGLVGIDGIIRSHIYLCRYYGVHPMAYESGPDLTYAASYIPTAMIDPRMGALQTATAALWFNNGGEITCFYGISPGLFTTNVGSQWAALQSYTDTSSPKYAAVMAGLAQPISYSNVYGSGLGVIDLKTYYQYSVRDIILKGLLGWYETGHFVDYVIPFAAAGSYTLTLNGLSNVSTAGSLYLDPTNQGNGTLIGTSHFVGTGGGWNVDSASSAVDVPDPITVTVPAGPHILRFIPSAAGTTKIGVNQLRVTKN